MKFNPNDLNKVSKIWGTYIPDRSPSFKAHSNRGQAISALKYRDTYKRVKGDLDFNTKVIPDECTLWQHNGAEWIEVIFEREYPNGQEGLVIK
jgi:hypothetical protein